MEGRRESRAEGEATLWETSVSFHILVKMCFHTWQVFLGSHLCDLLPAWSCLLFFFLFIFFLNLSHKTRGSHCETSDNREVELITEIAQQICVGLNLLMPICVWVPRYDTICTLVSTNVTFFRMFSCDGFHTLWKPMDAIMTL